MLIYFSASLVLNPSLALAAFTAVVFLVSREIGVLEDEGVIKQILNNLKYKADSEFGALPESRAPPAELPHGLV